MCAGISQNTKERLKKMKKKTLKNFSLAVTMLAVFVLWTLAVCFIDKSAIGPEGTKVGFARINGFFHEFTGRR